MKLTWEDNQDMEHILHCLTRSKCSEPPGCVTFWKIPMNMGDDRSDWKVRCIICPKWRPLKFSCNKCQQDIIHLKKTYCAIISLMKHSKPGPCVPVYQHRGEGGVVWTYGSDDHESDLLHSIMTVLMEKLGCICKERLGHLVDECLLCDIHVNIDSPNGYVDWRENSIRKSRTNNVHLPCSKAPPSASFRTCYIFLRSSVL